MTYNEWEGSLLSFKLNTWGWQERLGVEGRKSLAEQLFGKKTPVYLEFFNEAFEIEYEVLPITEESERIDLPPILQAKRKREEWEALQAHRRAEEKKRGIEHPAHVLALAKERAAKAKTKA